MLCFAGDFIEERKEKIIRATIMVCRADPDLNLFQSTTIKHTQCKIQNLCKKQRHK